MNMYRQIKVLFVNVYQTFEMEQESNSVNVCDEGVPSDRLKQNEILLEEFKELKETVNGFRAEIQALGNKFNEFTKYVETSFDKIEHFFKDNQNRGYKSGQERSGRRDSETPKEPKIVLHIPSGDKEALTAFSKQPSVCHTNNEYQRVFENFKNKFGLQDVSKEDSDAEVIFILKTCTMRVEDEATAAIEAVSKDRCSRVVLVLFYLTHQPKEVKASFYEHPGIRKTFHIEYEEKDESSNCVVT